MTDKELSTFLASVRRTRFVDYLDPLGETAHTAFDRRLSWARISQHDAAYADEARFLIDNADALRELLRRELEQDDWVEEVVAGREFDRGPKVASRPKPTVQEVFDAEDLLGTVMDTGKQKKSLRAPTMVPDEDGPIPPRASDAKAAARPGAPGARPAAPAAKATPARPAAKAPPLATTPGPTPRTGGRTGGVPDQPPPGPDGTPTPVNRVRSATPSGVPRVKPKPVTNVGARATPSMAPPQLPDEVEVSTPRPAQPRPQAAQQRAPTPKVRPAAPAAPTPEPESPPPGGTGIMELDEPATPPNVSALAPLRPNLRASGPSAPEPSPTSDEPRTAPSAIVRSKRPTPAPLERVDRSQEAPPKVDAGPVPRIRPSAPAEPREEAKGGTRLLPLLGVAAVGIGALVLVVMFVVPAVYRSDTGVLPPPPDPVAAPTPAPPPPAPPEVVPAGVQPALEVPGVAAPEPAPAVPAPAEPAPNAPGPAPAPAPAPAPTPTPTPAPAPEPAPVPAPAPEPEPAPAPAPVPAPVPEPDPVAAAEPVAPPVDVQGLWFGTTSTGGSFKLEVLGQTGGDFEGTVQAQLDDGTMFEAAVGGTVNDKGSLSFGGDGVRFSGKVSGGHASGSFTSPAGTSITWSADR